ncbi:MAG: DUF1553 domain-containing protein [Planctomycetaceae bacterium]
MLFVRNLAFALVCAASLGTPVVASFDVLPPKAELNGPHDRLQLVVTADAASDRPTDLTRAVRFENTTPQMLSVSETGLITPLKNGSGLVRIHSGSDVKDVPVVISNIAAETPVSFRSDVMPVLSKAGCNQGACHASQYGKGDLILSLLGYAPEQDHPALVRDRQQRRVSLVEPEDSLLLKKATLAVSHGGGQRFATGSYEYQVLRDWIAGGASGPDSREASVVGLAIYPENRVYQMEQSQQLRVIAEYSDNTSRDVTHVARYDSLGDSIANVSSTGYVTVVGHGQTAVMVRFEGQATLSHVLSPFKADVDLTDFATANFVDEHIRSHWQRLGVTPSPLCSDETFIRRAFLDSIGTLPEPERVREFVASTAADKREQLVNELLGLTGDPARDVYGNEWSAWWALKWGDLLRINRNDLGDGGMWSFSNWARNALRENMPVDQFVREIITAQGSIYKNGPANYFKTAKTPTDLAETTAQVFLGVRMQCAKCHHHPFEAYSQADYYGLAAFFTRVGTKTSSDFGALGADTVVKINPSGSIKHPRTGKVMEPTPLGRNAVDVTDVRDLRRPLATWLTSKDNDLFSRNIVNRIWGYYMGFGLVEPIDDMRATNPPSNPQLLTALADDFESSGFNLKHLMKAIMTSRVYQLDSTPLPENTANERLYVHYNVKRMPAEALLDAIDFACGTQERFSGVPLGTRAIELPDPNYASYFLDTLGRPQRVIACECERTSQPNLAQVLHIANGDVVNRKLADKNGRLTALEKADDATAVEQLYMVTISRRPTEEEQKNAAAVIARGKSRREGLENLLWALLNSREFLFVH